MQGARVQYLVRELEPAWRTQKILHAATKDPARSNEYTVCHN